MKTSLTKVNSRCFKLYRAYSISFSSSNLGIFFFWSWILKYCSKVQEKKKKVLVFVHVLHKTRNWLFSRRSRAVMAEKCFKKRGARCDASCCFANLNLFLFFPFSFTSPLSLLTDQRVSRSSRRRNGGTQFGPSPRIENKVTKCARSSDDWNGWKYFPSNLNKIVTKP